MCDRENSWRSSEPAPHPRRRALRHALLILLLLASTLAGCRSAEAPAPAAPSEPLCEATRPWPGIAPGVREEHRQLAYWLALDELAPTLDRVLMTAEEVDAHNAAMVSTRVRNEPLRMDLATEIDRGVIAKELERRVAAVRRQAGEAAYFLASGEPADAALRRAAEQGAAQIAALDAATMRRHVAAGEVHIRCAPFLESYYTASMDLAFDRNNCSVLKAGEPFVAFHFDDGPVLVRAGFTLGWITDDAPRTPAIDDVTFAQYARAPEARPNTARTQAAGGAATPAPRPTATLRLHPTQNAPSGSSTYWRATPGGLEVVDLPDDAVELADAPLTRRALLTEAFAYLGEEYGWGGREGFRDCSRLLMDAFAAFGVKLPRHSAIQQYAGDFWVDLEALDAEEKLAAIDAANQRGVALLHMDGHIMLYLGRSLEGEPMALHSYAEYLEPCPDGLRTPDGEDETLVVVNQVDVSTLALGAGTSRRSFLERIDRVTVLGGPPGPALDGLATRRSAVPVDFDAIDRCVDADDAALLTSPFHAHTQGPTRLVFASDEDPGPVAMTLRAPSGKIIEVDATRATGPPFSLIATAELDEPGTWRLAVGDGPRVLACRDFRVRTQAQRVSVGEGDAVWAVRNAWSPRFEALYSVFVRALVDVPADEGRVWRSFDELTTVAERNILFDYYGADEDARMTLTPDCADFPYLTRAYFAWKLGLPMGYRSCNRGREGRPPTCSELQTQADGHPGGDDVSAFRNWSRRALIGTVHSGSCRTHPADDATDLYPVALTREALRPGVVYADPDGHVLMIARWEPQPQHGAGTLVAVDAQPDGTIAMRMFWRGTFGFRPETDSVGAGFKAFRPVVADGEGWRALTNEELVDGSGFAPFSLQQYEGSADDFYDAVESLINPRPRDAHALQSDMIAALEQSVIARVHSVRLGVAAMDAQRWREVEMPRGYSIFETSGMWEDFATPARDMRLLIAIDAVLAVTEQVRRAPARYGVAADALDEAIAALEAARDEALEARSFAYARSDGSEWTLNLRELVARRAALEVAYNLNDCAEIRWGADPSSEEASTCARRAPEAQQARMLEYRAWFEARRRPAR